MVAADALSKITADSVAIADAVSEAVADVGTNLRSRLMPWGAAAEVVANAPAEVMVDIIAKFPSPRSRCRRRGRCRVRGRGDGLGQSPSRHRGPCHMPPL